MYHKAWRRSLSWWRLMFISKIGICFFVLALVLSVSAKESLEQQASSSQNRSTSKSYAGYKHVWPDIKFSWKIVVGTVIAFLGAAFGSVGGVGGGGFFVPMLTLIIGFDQKSSVAVSKCIITSGAAATVLYNVRLRHPSLELPLIDYDLALLFQPMLVLGISIGVSLNVILPEWIITIILIIVLFGTATKSFLKGIETWKKETKTKKNVLNASRSQESNGVSITDIEDGNTPSTTATNDPPETKQAKRRQAPILENVYWRQLGTITTVWFMILGLQIGKNYVKKCSVAYWSLDLLQIPVTVAVSSYKMFQLSQGKSTLSSRGSETAANWKMYKLVAYGAFGIVAGLIGGLLGLGGGFIMGPLFLEMGIPPQVSSATATFIMLFSSSISVVEYYLLKRFPVPYALYFAGVATVSAIIGQHVVGRVIKALGRASIIIFILAFTVYMNSFLLGGIGVANMVKKIQHKEYMGFENMCTHKS